MAKEQQIKVGDTVRMLNDGEYFQVAAVLLRLLCGGGDRSALALCCPTREVLSDVD